MKRHLLALVSLCFFSSCLFIGEPVSTRLSSDAFRVTEDVGRRVFVAVDDKIVRYSNSNGALTRVATWTIGLGWIVGIDATDRANEAWVLMHGIDGGPAIMYRYTFTPGTAPLRTAFVDWDVASTFSWVDDIAAGPNGSLYIVGSLAADQNKVAIARCVVRGDRCLSLKTVKRRGDDAGNLGFSPEIDVDLVTGDVYLAEWDRGIHAYAADLTPTRLPMAALEDANAVTAEDGFVVGGSDTYLRIYAREASGLTGWGARSTSRVQNVLAAGARLTDHCGYFWDLRVDPFENTSTLDYQRIGDDCD